MRSADLPEQVKLLEVALIRGALEAADGSKSRAVEALGITRQGCMRR